MDGLKALGVGLFLTAFGAVFLFFTYMGIHDDLWMTSHAARTTGRVVAAKRFQTTTGAGHAGKTWKARVVFYDDAHQKHSFWSDGYIFLPYKVGAAVTVLYDPSGGHRPKMAEDLKNGKQIYLVFLGIGVICCSGGIYLALTRRLPKEFTGIRRDNE